MARRAPLALGALLVLLVALAAALPERAIQLRNLGIAQLENEQPAEAERTFQELARLVPDDPLPPGNLAIALLRQQKSAEALAAVDRALARWPRRPDLLAIKGDILQWAGEREEALVLYRRAAALAPDDPEIHYAVYRMAASLEGAAAQAAREESLAALSRLRPENAVVLLQRLHRAIERGDRAVATASVLRLRELSWQLPPVAAQALEMVVAPLEAGDVAAARVPALRLENVLKISPMFQQGLRELQTGIQGIPLERFTGEPPPASFGDPVSVAFAGQRLADGAIAGRALGRGDFDGDGRPDLARVVAGKPARLELRLSGPGGARRLDLPAGLDPAGLLVADLDNDGHLDLLVYGASATSVLKGGEGAAFTLATDAFGLARAGATAAAAIDFDIEGDLDLALAGGASGGGDLYLNNLAGPLQRVGNESLPRLDAKEIHDLVATDLDRDGDLDLLVAHEAGLVWLDNLRQGTFADRTRAGGLGGAAGARAAVSADLDGDGWPDLVTAGKGVAFFRNRGGVFELWDLGRQLRTSAAFHDVVAFDADNDGRLDLALAGEGGVTVLAREPGGGFRFLPVEGGPSVATALVAADLDGDGDLDLAAAGPDGLHRLDNRDGDANHWLAVRLRGLDKGNSKNNLFGLGATLEVWNGAARQFREVTEDTTHFGLGRQRAAEILRVVWTNGVPQNRLELAADQVIVEEQILKGSCPFLYAWDGEGFGFVTDLLWGAPAGLPLAPGVWAPADPSELVRVDGARARDGRYELRVTEELWEAAFFDHARLWVVDHPADVEVASGLRILPGESTPETVLATRHLRPLAAARDAQGRDVTERLAARDEVYADGWEASPYQGRAARPWTLTFDLGEAPAAPVRLHLDGWIFPADASLNLALAQRGDLDPVFPRLEVETTDGWEILVAATGHPAGKTKTMVVDTPPLPAGARRLRLVSNLWLSFDRAAWSASPADGAAVVAARLLPESADLRYRGFSALVRCAPNAPHAFDYARVATDSPWLPFPGRYTRYGDVRELLGEPDDLSVILGPGDELALVFDASALPPPPAGWTRTVFLESHGWDKDADRNTWRAAQVDPLPFRAMSGYPYGPGEAFPRTERHRAYEREWLTRVVE